VLLPLLALVVAVAAPARAQTACTLETAAEDCDDGDACTDDACGPDDLCVNAPLLDCLPCATDEDCDDGEPCTDDACDAPGRCAVTPNSGNPCDDGDGCTGPDACDAGTCVGDLLTCDDGVSCTDDYCDGAGCVSEPVDGFCAESNECAMLRCRPGDPDAGADGCVVDTRELEAAECAPDDDPCTEDRCRTAACAHEPVADVASCSPLRPSYRRTLALRSGVERILAFIWDESDVGGDAGDVIVDELLDLLDELDAGARVLGGLDAGRPLPPGTSRGLRLPPNPSTAQLRGRLAYPFLRDAPLHADRVLRAVSEGRRRDDVGAGDAAELRRNGRILLAETKALKRDLKNLQRTYSVFQR
jgi:hypothetical protein